MFVKTFFVFFMLSKYRHLHSNKITLTFFVWNIYSIDMELQDLSKTDRDALADKIGRNREHLSKIAHGERPCPARLALLIENATGGLIRKEQLVGWE